MKQDQNIDDFFREQLGGYVETPPPDAWETLQQQLNTTGGAGAAGFSMKLIAKILMGSLVSCATAVGIIHFMHRDKPSPLQFTATAQQTNVQERAVASSGTASALAAVAGQTTMGQDESSSMPNQDESSSMPNKDGALAATTSQTTPDDHNGVTLASSHSALRVAENASKSSHRMSGGKASRPVAHSAGSSTHGPAAIRRHSGHIGTAGVTPLLEATAAMRPSVGAKASGPAPENTAPDGTASAPAANDLQAVLNSLPTTTSPSTTAHASGEVAAAEPMKTFKDEEKKDETKKLKTPAEALADAALPLATQTKKSVNPFEIGVKAGFERGTAGGASKNAIISGYIDYKFNDRISLSVQPGIKTIYLANNRFTASQSYIHVNADGAIHLTDSGKVLVIVDSVVVDSFAAKHYTYSQTHDSIVKFYATGGNYANFELPVIFKYSLFPNFKMQIGAVLNYAALAGVNEQTYTKYGIVQTATVTVVAPGYVAPPAVSKVILYDAKPISSYSGPLYNAPKGHVFSVGYVLGFSYGFWNRYTADVLIQQSSGSPYSVEGRNIHQYLADTYWRLSLGYRLW